jgi:hypothetical protein
LQPFISWCEIDHNQIVYMCSIIRWLNDLFVCGGLLNMNVECVNSNGRYSVQSSRYAGQLKIRSFVTQCASEPTGRKLTTTLTFLRLMSTSCTCTFNIQEFFFLSTLYLCVLYLSENRQRLTPLTP